MSNELVMAAVAAENLPWEGLVERQPDGTEKTLYELYYPDGRQKAERFVTFDEALAEHPNAYWRVAIRPDDIWRPPPGDDERAQDPEVRRRKLREHREDLRRDLEAFINRHLGDLEFMYRTRHLVVGKVRVKVVEFRPIPKYALRAFASKIGKVKRTGKRLVIPPPGAEQVMIARDTAPARKRRAKAAKAKR